MNGIRDYLTVGMIPILKRYLNSNLMMIIQLSIMFCLIVVPDLESLVSRPIFMLLHQIQMTNTNLMFYEKFLSIQACQIYVRSVKDEYWKYTTFGMVMSTKYSSSITCNINRLIAKHS